MTYPFPEFNKIAHELEQRDRFETYEHHAEEDEDGWEETAEDVVDEMLETFDIITCSNCKNEYSILNVEWVDGDCNCPKCNQSTGETYE